MLRWRIHGVDRQCRDKSAEQMVRHTLRWRRHQLQRQHHQHQYQRQHQQIRFCPALLIVLLVLLQHIEMHMCRHLGRVDDGRRIGSEKPNVAAPAAEKRLRLQDSLSGDRFRGTAVAEIFDNVEKRAAAAVGLANSQPEEIFIAPNGNDMEMNYDEYPMVVPKRAALLLDRLMVALHHALEQERSGHRISQFYTEPSLALTPFSDGNHQNSQNDKDHGKEDAAFTTTRTTLNSHHPIINNNNQNPNNNDNNNYNYNNNNNNNNFHMYSDDDPNVMLDYDFKDLNSINRATGETLMAKSFQRRANFGDGDGGGGGGGGGSGGGGRGGSGGGRMDGDRDGVGLLKKMPTLNGDASVLVSGSGASGGRRINAGSGGRMYWRCYFNAVSCF